MVYALTLNWSSMALILWSARYTSWSKHQRVTLLSRMTKCYILYISVLKQFFNFLVLVDVYMDRLGTLKT